MPKVPKPIRDSLKREAEMWEASIHKETPEQIEELLKEAEPFAVTRPPRQPVSVHLDPHDISMLKRLARRMGIPYSQLISMWLHERIQKEKTSDMVLKNK